MNNNDIQEYVGTDVIRDVCNNTKLLSKKFFPNKIIDIYECPSEKLENKKIL